MLKLTPIHEFPALLIETSEHFQRAIVVADLHIGVEYEYRTAGINIPSQTPAISEMLVKLCHHYKPRQIIMVGDIKHRIPTSSWQEFREIPNLFNTLLELVDKIVIVPGNHDGKLVTLLPSSSDDDEIKIESVRGFVATTGVGCFHGHSWPAKEILEQQFVIVAHNHPQVVFRDRLGGKLSYPCWLRTKFKLKVAKEYYPALTNKTELIVMPAVTTYGEGIKINDSHGAQFLGPLFTNKLVDIGKSQVYMLDGTYLGTLRMLKRLVSHNC